MSPLFGRRIVAVDTNTVIYYLEGHQLDDELRFVFESPPSQLTIKLGRQVMNETLHPVLSHPGQRWQSVASLVNSGKALLFGTATLPPADRQIFDQLRTALRICVSEADSAVLADSLVYRLHLFTRELRLRNAVRLALRNAQVAGFLTSHGLSATYSDIVAD
jgi:hypothetical protein